MRYYDGAGTRRELARELDVSFSLVRQLIQRKLINPAAGLISGSVPRIDLRSSFTRSTGRCGDRNSGAGGTRRIGLAGMRTHNAIPVFSFPDPELES